jgi:predicted transcriptional regulator
MAQPGAWPYGYHWHVEDAFQETIDVVRQVHDDGPLEGRQFAASVLRGLEEASRGEGISHEELKDRLIRWRESSGRRKLSET